jgi:Zn-dependent protease
MFTDPGRSQWDLQFRLLGIPIRVHPMFWLMSVLLGQSSLQFGVEYLVIWVGCVFVSILIHEMGHVLAARAFDVDGQIVLYGFGGLAIPAGQMRNRWQHIVVCFAGPLAGFLLLALLVLCLLGIAPEDWEYVKNGVKDYFHHDPDFRQLLRTPKRAIIHDLFWINLIWGLVNLLPIWPLDGGQISRDVFTIVSPRNGGSVALGLSLVLAGILVVNSLMAMNKQYLLPDWVPGGDWWTVVMFGLLAVGSFMALQEAQSKRNWTDDHWSRWDER